MSRKDRKRGQRESAPLTQSPFAGLSLDALMESADAVAERPAQVPATMVAEQSPEEPQAEPRTAPVPDSVTPSGTAELMADDGETEAFDPESDDGLGNAPPDTSLLPPPPLPRLTVTVTGGADQELPVDATSVPIMFQAERDDGSIPAGATVRFAVQGAEVVFQDDTVQEDGVAAIAVVAKEPGRFSVECHVHEKDEPTESAQATAHGRVMAPATAAPAAKPEELEQLREALDHSLPGVIPTPPPTAATAPEPEAPQAPEESDTGSVLWAAEAEVLETLRRSSPRPADPAAISDEDLDVSIFGSPMPPVDPNAIPAAAPIAQPAPAMRPLDLSTGASVSESKIDGFIAEATDEVATKKSPLPPPAPVPRDAVLPAADPALKAELEAAQAAHRKAKARHNGLSGKHLLAAMVVLAVFAGLAAVSGPKPESATTATASAPSAPTVPAAEASTAYDCRLAGNEFACTRVR